MKEIVTQQNENHPIPKPDDVKFPNKKKQLYIIVGVLAVVLLVGGFMALQHNQDIDAKINSVVESLLDSVKSDIKYPTTDKDSYIWEAGGYYDQVKDKKKLAQAIISAMEDMCTKKVEEETNPVFSSDGIRRAYRLAVVLEYLGYENPDVKNCLDSLTTQALAEVDNEDWNKTTRIYKDLQPFTGLAYYTGRNDLLTNEEIEKTYYARWQAVKAEAANGDAGIFDFLSDVYEIAAISPVEVPAQRLSGKQDSQDVATAVNEVAIPSVYLDIDKMAPYEEVVAFLTDHGTAAIFRNGQGGYYDSRNEKGTLYGDFRVQFISGRVKRTGKEDAFTEQYLRDHYDSPSKTYYYFRGERVNKFPAFFNDTKQVFVYDGAVFAVSDYGIYFGSDMLPYDYERAKNAEFKHITLSEEALINHIINSKLRPSVTNSLSEFQPTIEYDAENKIVIVYLTALPGTTKALEDGEEIPFSAQSETTMKWSDFVSFLERMPADAQDEFIGFDIGIGIIVGSDVNPDAGLLSLLNGEVVADNSENPLSAADKEEVEQEPQQENEEPAA